MEPACIRSSNKNRASSCRVSDLLDIERGPDVIEDQQPVISQPFLHSKTIFLTVLTKHKQYFYAGNALYHLDLSVAGDLIAGVVFIQVAVGVL